MTIYENVPMGKMQWLVNGYKENKRGPIFDLNFVLMSACNGNLKSVNIVYYIISISVLNIGPILVSNIVQIQEVNVCLIFKNEEFKKKSRPEFRTRVFQSIS